MLLWCKRRVSPHRLNTKRKLLTHRDLDHRSIIQRASIIVYVQHPSQPIAYKAPTFINKHLPTDY